MRSRAGATTQVLDAATESTGGLAAPLAGRFGVRFAPGDLLAGRFLIEGFLGRGGMGEVYEAQDLELEGRVALKALRPEIARDRAALRRFRQEIQLARQVTHPGVCRVFDVFRHSLRAPGAPRGVRSDPETEDVAFISMELLSGETLADRLRRVGRLEPEAVLPIALQAIAALEAAHAAGVVHQDFKSSNVVLARGSGGAERAVVTDFGLACRLGAGEAPSEILGTPAYMAPEQVLRQHPTPRTDVYALGVVLFEMVTGRLPFEGRGPIATMTLRLSEPAPAPRSLQRQLDPSWNAIILRCLERDPERRFATPGEVARALTGEAGREAAAAQQLRRAQRRHRLTLAGIAGALLAAAGFVASRPSPPHPAPVAERLTGSVGLDVYPALSPDGACLAYSSNQSGRFEIYLKHLGRAELRLTHDGQQNVQPAWSPDGTRIAYHSRLRGGIWVMPAGGGAAQQLAVFGSRPAWSRDGRRLAFQSDPLADLAANTVVARAGSTIWTVRADGGELTRVTEPDRPPGGHAEPGFLPGGRLVFSVHERARSALWSTSATGGRLAELAREYQVIDPMAAPDGHAVYYIGRRQEGDYLLMRVPLTSDGIAAGEPERVTALGSSTPRHLAIAPDGRRIAFASLNITSNLWLLPIAAKTGNAAGDAVALTSDSGRNSRPAFSADGTRLAFEKWAPAANPDVWSLDLASGGATQLTSDPALEQFPAFSPAGNEVLYLRQDGRVKELWAIDAATGARRLLTLLPRDAGFTRLSPDGRTLAFDSALSGDRTRLCLLALGGGAPFAIGPADSALGYPVWSPDGRWLAAQRRQGEDIGLVLVSVVDGRVAPLVDEPGQTWAYGFSPDGDKVLYARLDAKGWQIGWVSRRTHRQQTLLVADRPNVYLRYPIWSPRGDRVVYEQAETSGNIWMIELPRPDRR